MTKLRGQFKGENDFCIDGYRVSNEIADSKLYIYDENDDLTSVIDMPDFWEQYLFESWETDPGVDQKFEKYIIQELGL